MKIAPYPGMQAKVMSSPATIVFAGARAGVGKSYSLCLCPTQFVARRIPASAIIFRRRAKDLFDEGGILRDARAIYRPLGARYREPPRADFRWWFDEGELAVAFKALPEPRSAEDYQGFQFGMVGFDELTHFELRHFAYMLTRRRDVKTARYDPFVVATLNPIDSGWIRDLVDWWIGEDGFPIREREGVVRWMVKAPDDWHTEFVVEEREELLRRWPKSRPISFTLIPGRPEDNPSQDWEAYQDMLANQEEWIRASLLEGNWNVGPEDEAKIWRLPNEALFDDDDPDFRRMVDHSELVDLYGGWDYGRATHGLCWILGALQPGTPPTLWIIGARIWTGASAQQAASDRAWFLEALDVDLNVGEIRDAGDPSGWNRDSTKGWAENLRSHGVPLVDLRHLFGESRHRVYWNSREGFSITTSLVQTWLNSGQLRIRRHPTTRAVISAIRSWRLSVPEGERPIEINRDYLGPDKGIHSHPGDALRYLVAFVAASARVKPEQSVPISNVVAHAQAARAARLMGSRGGWSP